MTVRVLKEKLNLSELTMPDGDAWITIMSNINIVAVATLCDTALIILAEGVTIDDAVKNTANDKDINILSSKESAFTLASKIAELLP